MRYLSNPRTDAGYRALPGGTPIPGESQQASEHAWEWRVATFVVRIDALTASTGGTTRFAVAHTPFTGVNQSNNPAYFRDDPGIVSGRAAVKRDITEGDPLEFIFIPAPPL